MSSRAKPIGPPKPLALDGQRRFGRELSPRELLNVLYEHGNRKTFLRDLDPEDKNVFIVVAILSESLQLYLDKKDAVGREPMDEDYSDLHFVTEGTRAVNPNQWGASEAWVVFNKHEAKEIMMGVPWSNTNYAVFEMPKILAMAYTEAALF